jgi:hypothetical protein
MADRRPGKQVVELTAAVQRVGDDSQRQGVAPHRAQVLAEQGGGAGDLTTDRSGNDLAVVMLPTGDGARQSRHDGVPGQGPEIDRGEREGGISVEGPAQRRAWIVARVDSALGESVPTGGHSGRRQRSPVPIVGHHDASIERPADVALRFARS